MSSLDQPAVDIVNEGGASRCIATEPGLYCLDDLAFCIEFLFAHNGKAAIEHFRKRMQFAPQTIEVGVGVGADQSANSIQCPTGRQSVIWIFYCPGMNKELRRGRAKHIPNATVIGR
ncbi:hypothetical protein D9M68_935240 [compost metagenome]